jgi:signal transduction histidine kinase
LVATLEILAREFAQQSSIEIHCELAPVKLEATAELVVYRVVQEAITNITNITKYAKARHVWLGMAARGGQVEVAVRDTGVKPNSADGLVGTRFRVEAEGGTMAVESAPGRGATVRVTLPEPPPVSS